MQLEVYQTDGEAYEAAAALAAGALAEAVRAGGTAAAAVAGGRGGRAWLAALAARRELPADRVTWVLADESRRADDPDGTGRLVQEHLVVGRGVPAAQVVTMALDGADPAAVYAAVLAERFGAPPVLDVVCLDLAPDGGIAGLAPNGTAVDATTWAADEPRRGRVTLTPGVLGAARRIVVTATGAERAAALLAALREPVDVAARPGQLVLPSSRATWVVDRAAAGPLLRDASAVDGGAA